MKTSNNGGGPPSTDDTTSSSTTVTLQSGIELPYLENKVKVEAGLEGKRVEEVEGKEEAEGKEEEKPKPSNATGSNPKSKQQKIRMPQRKGGMQLWQFLYALLEDPEKRYGELIEWTDNRQELEFRLLDPEAIAIWWGNIKHRANMTYERLSRSLRYYYDRGILKKMGGERYLYRFCVDPEDMYKHIGNSDSRPVLKPMPVPVSKWMYSRLIPQGVFFPSSLAPPEYSTILQQSTLPPPPPYPGFQLDPFYQLNPVGYDYLTHISQETETPYTNMPQYDSLLQPLELPEEGAYSANTTLAASSSTITSLYPSSPDPEYGRSLSEGSFPIVAVTQQINFPSQTPMEYFTQMEQEAEIGCHFQIGTNSPDHSGSSSSGGDNEMALDEILPILASMEHSEGMSLLPPIDTLTSPRYTSSPSIHSPSPTLPSTPPFMPSNGVLSPPAYSCGSNMCNYSTSQTSWPTTTTTEQDVNLWNVNFHK